MATEHQRRNLAALMDLLVQHAAKIHYPLHDQRTETVHQIETMVDLRRELASPAGLTMDCSQSISLLCHVAGLDDPNRDGYSSDGYTGTLLANKALRHYSDPGGANVGAIVIFGPGTGEHACMVRHPGRDPILFSHGFEGGPIYTPLSAERRFHDPPVTFLAITSL